MCWSFTAFLSAAKPNLHTQHISHGLSGFLLCRGGDMGVGVQCEACREVTEHSADSLDVHSVKYMLRIKDTREYRGTPSIFILKGGIGGFQLQQCDITIGEAVVHLAGRVFMDRPCHGAAHRCLERMPR